MLLTVLLGTGCSKATDDTAVPHGDHTPKFGGLVLMDGDLHFEVVAQRSGKYQVHFSDAIRTPLPASRADDVAVTVFRPSADPEVVTMAPDAADEHWSGAGRPIETDDATVRVGYVHEGKPYSIDLPIAGWR